MSLNSAVTADGGEIGRSQALQAQACGIEPLADINPVLLKPNTNTGAQVIIRGQVLRNMEAKTFQAYKVQAMKAVMDSYNRLSRQFDIVVVEGAGSPAEINLRQNDIANMGFAEQINCPVVLVGDIDRGGVFAHLAGTLAILDEMDGKRIKGFIINRFRGDPDILRPAVDWLERYTRKPVFGVVPYLTQLHLDAEDSLSVRRNGTSTNSPKTLRVIAPGLPHLSNSTDFDALIEHPQVNFSLNSHPDGIYGSISLFCQVPRA